MIKNKVIEEVVIVVGLIVAQILLAGNSILLGYLLSFGLTPFTLVTCFSFFVSIFLAPFAIYFERSKWPKKLTLKLMILLFLISFLGITLMQFLFIKGIGLASPAMANAMPNLAPGLIFVIAWTLRLEKVDLSCAYSRVKIVGTILCVLGAITMGLMHSAASSKDDATNNNHRATFDQDKIYGFLYLVAAVLALSTNIILQAITLADMPAPMSLSAITSFFGMIFAVMLQLVQQHALQWGSPGLTFKNLIIFSILGGVVGGSGVTFSGWAIKKKGPVLVSMFNPVGTVFTVAFSFITLRETISLGSIAGMIVLFIGLYTVLWAKRKEASSNTKEDLENSGESK